MKTVVERKTILEMKTIQKMTAFVEIKTSLEMNICGCCVLNRTRDRMKHALLSLIKTPQNNFKLWRVSTLICTSD